jgi:hypothetical protein
MIAFAAKGSRALPRSGYRFAFGGLVRRRGGR